MDVYTQCPILENENYQLRFVREADAPELLQVYSDEKALPFFNSDNCPDPFHYTTLEQMNQEIMFWLYSYQNRFFVRWTIVDQSTGCAIGTVELFNRRADDYFDNCGLLRLDLRNDYETEKCIYSILDLIVPPAFDMFQCGKIATKAIPSAGQRCAVLQSYGFVPCPEPLIGHDGKPYFDYFVFEKP